MNTTVSYILLVYTVKKINKNVTRVNKTGKCAQQQVTRVYTHASGVYSCRAKVFFSN